MRPLDWLSILTAGLALGLNAFGLGGSSFVMILAVSSLALAGFELIADPKRAVFLLTFLLSLPVLVSVMSLYDRRTGEAALVAVAIAIHLRLFFVRRARAGREANRALASSLREAIPEKATVFVDMDIEGECQIADLTDGHLIRVRPEEQIPTDGQVTFGSSFVDERLLTGDPEPRTKSMGAFVFGASKNKNGSLIFRASAAPKNSFACRLAGSLERGLPFESLWGRPLLLLEACLLFGALLIYVITGPRLAPLLNVFLASTGTAFAAALWARDSSLLQRSAELGFWWKSKASLLRVGSTGMVVAGTTGVLTEGRLRLAAVEGVGELSEDGVLRLLGPLARRLENDYAFAILRELQTRNIRLEMMDTFMELPGGATGLITGEDIRWVDLETARLEDLPLARVESFVGERVRAGEKVHLLFRGPDVGAALAFTDRILPTAGQGIHLLKRENVPFLLVTADGELPTRRLREELNIQHHSPDSGNKEVKHLLEKLENDGLRPLWLSSPGWNIPGGVVPAAQSASLGGSCEAISLRGDIHSVAKLVDLAKVYLRNSRYLARVAFFFQIALIVLSPFLDPRLAALLGAIPGFVLLSNSKSR